MSIALDETNLLRSYPFQISQVLRTKNQPHHGFKDDGPSSKDLHWRPAEQRQQVRHRGRRQQDRPRHGGLGRPKAAGICLRRDGEEARCGGRLPGAERNANLRE